MTRGFYTAANGILTEQRVIDMIANNIANINTAGYKTDKEVTDRFSTWLVKMQGEPGAGEIGYRSLETTYTDISQGLLAQTDSKLDLAIEGNVFFNIETLQGETLLTKAGQFSVDGEGYLALGNNGRVCDDAGNPIQIMTSDFTVDPTGVITTAQGAQFTLGLTYIEDSTDVEKVGDTLFRPYDAAITLGNIPEGYAYQIRQGFYERSNGDVASLQISASSHQGVFTACSTAIKVMQQLNALATQDMKI
ncbi:MAG: flagellar hook-basal body complex protein [Ruminococcus sp.]|jgi:flagellar basal-body rod protein FlgG|nr:flagellar hook-basal body complex protein [Ruminococcus sp.]